MEGTRAPSPERAPPERSDRVAYAVLAVTSAFVVLPWVWFLAAL